MDRAGEIPHRSFYVLGGRQWKKASTLDERRAFEAAVALEVDASSGGAATRLAYVAPREVQAPEGPPRNVFKAGTRVGDLLYACTETEVLVLELPSFERRRYLSLPPFNDLHHVAPRADGHLLVANTGLDMVMEVDERDRVVREWSAAGGDPWERFDRAVDYRRVPSTKPHAAHPNYVFQAQGEIWVTRFEQRDAICLTTPERRIEIGVQRPHDGIVVGDRVYFTTVDGHVVVADLATDRLERVTDLNPIVGSPYALGWCRGIAVLDEVRVVVGFSRLRPTRFRENLRWLQGRVGLRDTFGSLPTRIACFDLEAESLLWERNLEDAGVNVIFSIHGAGAGGGRRADLW